MIFLGSASAVRAIAIASATMDIIEFPKVPGLMADSVFRGHKK